MTYIFECCIIKLSITKKVLQAGLSAAGDFIYFFWRFLMKKIGSILLILSVLLSTLFITSCSEDPELDPFANTYDKWYLYKKTVDVPVADKDTADTNKDGVLKGAKVYVKYNTSNGLEVMVVTTQKQTISYLGGAYEVEADVTTGGSQTFEDFASAKWKGLILLGSFIKEDPPTITVDLSSALKGKLNLRRVLAEFILNNLLGE